MEPEIRYTTTADGVSVAYYTMGEGHPLFITSSVLYSHLQRDTLREYHRGGNGLGRGLQVVRYDARGTGLSDRHSLDFSMDARILDLEAVAERTKLKRFAIFGLANGAPAAIAYAAGNPDRVSHLILSNAYARGRDALETSRRWDSLRERADKQWEYYTLTLANANTGFRDSEAARKLASLYRESMTPESMRAFLAAQGAIDVTALLPRVAVPTLVMCSFGGPTWLEWSREVASKIPDARFVTVTGRDDPWWADEQTRIVEEFLGVSQDASAIAPHTGSTGTAVILFTDIVASTALTERMGDAAFRDASRALDEQLRTAIRDAGGTPVDGKVLGDGVMATFLSASQAIAAALRCSEVSARSGLQLHLGIHAGDVIREADPGGQSNVYGGAVNIASRICGLSAPGEILVSDVVRGMARSSAGVEFEDRGDQEMKGVGDAVRVYAIRKGA
ncbi:MAG: adenylate/guanylate cyclase domain-containing protein [Chloroflexota bacterium]|nr:adenylate/guanylate cyclase domain-containing protein [Chloroflexota bacterium]